MGFVYPSAILSPVRGTVFAQRRPGDVLMTAYYLPIPSPVSKNI